jgi:hypothetical protein
MLSLKFDSGGTQKIKWPSSDVAIIETARKLIRAETALPDGRCFPRLNLLRHTLAAAEEAAGVIALDESATVMNENAAVAVAEDFSRIITAGLTYFHAHELECLADWGITVLDGKSQAPSAKPALIEMLQKYVDKELSLPVAERLPSPPLDQVAAVSTALVAAQKNRAQTREKKNAKGRSPEIQRLFDLLQLAAGFHVVINFDGEVDERLEPFGFEITVARPRKPKQPAGQGAEPEHTEPAESDNNSSAKIIPPISSQTLTEDTAGE